MVETKLKKDLPFDNQNYQIFEYADLFHINSQKKVKIKDFGEKITKINSFFHDYLKEFHIPTAFIKKDDSVSLKFVKYDALPFQIKILNSADKRTAKIFSLKEGSPLELPVFEYHYRNHNDSLMSESHVIAFNMCNSEDLKMINRICSKINAVMKSFFERRNISMGELTCCFGKFEEKVYLTGSFSPDSLKLIPTAPNKKWKDAYKLTSASEIKYYTDQILNYLT